jgi:UV DNA damage repair endonuclease
VGAILVEGPNRRTHFWKTTIQWLFNQNFVLIELQTRRFLWEFPIGSYVKLSSAVVAILVGVLKCWTQFWKRTTQESFQQSLVEIGSVVSEEKIFLKFHPPFFLICIIGQNRQKFKVHKKSRNVC